MNELTWLDYGFNSFMTRTIPSSNKLSPIAARSLIPVGGISPSMLISPLNATTDIVFSSTDSDTAAWTSGVIYFADGTNSGTIDEGNTGDISATTYVYYDREILGTLQTTTTVSNATKFNRLLIAIIEEGASGKDCKITPLISAGLNVSGITADQIAANTITSAEIAANTITASEIAAGAITATELNVSQLDAITANTGTLTVDESITAGGTADGVIYVKDSLDSTKVTMDTDGIAVASTGDITVGGDSLNTNAEIFSHLSVEHFFTGSGTYIDRTGSYFSIDGDNFTNQTVYFETVMAVEQAGRIAYTHIYDITAGAVLTGSEIQSQVVGITAPERVRSPALTFPSGRRVYKLQIKQIPAGNGGDNAHYYAARLVIVQT